MQEKETNQITLERHATARELCEVYGLKDRRILRKLGVKCVRFSGNCVRYSVVDFLRKVESLTIKGDSSKSVNWVKMLQLTNGALELKSKKKTHELLLHLKTVIELYAKRV